MKARMRSLQPGIARPVFARLARQKAARVAVRIDRGLVLGSDTVAECEGQILGKPANEDRARRMLQTLSGREHRVSAGYVSGECPAENRRSAWPSAAADGPAAPKEIDDYLASGLWEGKAGHSATRTDWAGCMSSPAASPMS